MTIRILRIPRIDSPDGSSVLIHLVSSSVSSLDLQLTATDGFSPYVVRIEESRISELRTKQNKYSTEEWAEALRWSLLQHQTTPGKSFENLELVASLPSDDQLCLSLRLVISGISQYLGNIHMTEDRKETIQLFDWAQHAAVQAAAANSKLLALEKNNETLSATIRELNAQLREFSLIKDRDESTNFVKFRQILNSKKLKIRNQQRLLIEDRVHGTKPRTNVQIKNPMSISIKDKDEERANSRKRNLSGNDTANAEVGSELAGSHGEVTDQIKDELSWSRQPQVQENYPTARHDPPIGYDSEETDDEL